ncbi:hypothetical protein SSX86_023653 [Deinandra increscens subsp. villosa]|uniref:C2H2-type domain-containing protein n=1 Tax=Deinandra increscens subsp. villosa TaxID=3103831 RepID=A0AAP0CL88_9ASTR
MEATQGFYYNLIMADSRDMILKKKPSKRPRPSSPLALTMASTSSATTTATSEDGDDENPINTFHMPTGSIEFTKIPQENKEEEEEEMANCLILLAQSQSSPPPHTPGEVGKTTSESFPPPHTPVEVAEGKTTSGIYVYECKTCYRGFSSFQALGGHRASHKIKPCKPSLEDKSRPHGPHIAHSSTMLSLQLGGSNHMNHCNPSGSMKAAKIHECSICGVAFSSGQALGGHMRRHRSVPMAITSCDSGGQCQESKKAKTIPSLDLNLPAPNEDDQREAKFAFRSRDQMIVFSNSSLVQCHF